MNISELEANQKNVEVTGKITQLEEVREFEKFGKSGRVCNADLTDDSGSIKLTLWNEEIDQISEGTSIKIENGYIKEWQGEKQLSVGKYGKMTIL